MKEITKMIRVVNLKEFTTVAKMENLDAVQDFISDELEASDCTITLQTQISLIVEEVFVNIANYAYSQDSRSTNSLREQYSAEVGYVTIRIAVGDEVFIEFEDNGKPFNPLEIDDPDITLDLNKRKLGGLGIYLVKNMTDAIKYKYKDNKNILSIKKKRHNYQGNLNSG